MGVLAPFPLRSPSVPLLFYAEAGKQSACVNPSILGLIYRRATASRRAAKIYFIFLHFLVDATRRRV